MKTIQDLTLLAQNRIDAQVVDDVDTPEKAAAYIQSVIVEDAKMYLAETDYIVVKISEANILGQAVAEMLSEYQDVLANRAEARSRINGQ